MGFNKLDKVLDQVDRVFTGVFLILLGFTGFYWVLLGLI